VEKELRNLTFVVLAVCFLVALATALLYAYLRSRRSTTRSWDDLLRQLIWIDRDAIHTIALDAISESGEPRPSGDGFELEPAAIWNLLGGMDGLEAIQRNCAVLIELASYIQRTYPEALVVAEQLRLNAREIEWHIGRLRGAEQTGNLKASFDSYAQRAVVSYYLMTQHLLALYGSAGFSRIAELQQAI
jgi:hypothetical protein